MSQLHSLWYATSTEDTNLLESTSNSMAQIAQLVERRTRHPEVGGSNPTLGEVFELRPLTQNPIVIRPEKIDFMFSVTWRKSRCAMRKSNLFFISR